MSHFFLFNITFSSYRQKIISMKLLSSTSTHAVRGEKIVPPLPCPTPCSSLELGSLRAVGCGRAGNHCCSPLSLLCYLLCTHACGQSHGPLGARQGKEETSGPASALCHTVGGAVGTAGQHWVGKTQGFSRNGSREQGRKAQRLMRGNGLLHCRDRQKQNHKDTLVAIDRSMDQGSFPEQWRAINIFLFH